MTGRRWSAPHYLFLSTQRRLIYVHRCKSGTAIVATGENLEYVVKVFITNSKFRPIAITALPPVSQPLPSIIATDGCCNSELKGELRIYSRGRHYMHHACTSACTYITCSLQPSLWRDGHASLSGGNFYERLFLPTAVDTTSSMHLFRYSAPHGKQEL